MVDFDSNVKLVYSVYTKYFAKYNWLKDDLIQEGMFGLLKACKSYSEDKGTTFSTFACKCIYNQMAMSLRKEYKHLAVTKSLDDYLDDDENKHTILELYADEDAESNSVDRAMLEAVKTLADELGVGKEIRMKLQSKTTAQIAEEMKVSKQCIAKRLSRFYATARQRLSPSTQDEK